MSKRSVLLALAALLIAAGSAYAQSVKFNVPFQFTAGTTLMPAGDYFIESHSGTLIIRGGDRQRFVNSIPVESRDAQSQTKVVFRCYSSLCFLAQGWTEGNKSGWKLVVNRQERLVAKHDPALRAPVVEARR